MTRRKCYFCQANINPEYKEYEVLRKYISRRGKMLPREKTYICTKHQRKLALAIKRARILALLPYVVYEE